MLTAGYSRQEDSGEEAAVACKAAFRNQNESPRPLNVTFETGCSQLHRGPKKYWTRQQIWDPLQFSQTLQVLSNPSAASRPAASPPPLQKKRQKQGCWCRSTSPPPLLCGFVFLCLLYFSAHFIDWSCLPCWSKCWKPVKVCPRSEAARRFGTAVLYLWALIKHWPTP